MKLRVTKVIRRGELGNWVHIPADMNPLIFMGAKLKNRKTKDPATFDAFTYQIFGET